MLESLQTSVTGLGVVHAAGRATHADHLDGFMILAELGARVIKIEEPNRGDETRSFEPFVERGGATESAYYFACNRSKQSVTVNLRAHEGQTIIRDLARQADVFLENFPVGTLKRYGLDYGAIRAVNANIVYVSCTGFGQSGPLAHRKGYDTIFQAMPSPPPGAARWWSTAAG